MGCQHASGWDSVPSQAQKSAGSANCLAEWGRGAGIPLAAGIVHTLLKERLMKGLPHERPLSLLTQEGPRGLTPWEGA